MLIILDSGEVSAKPSIRSHSYRDAGAKMSLYMMTSLKMVRDIHVFCTNCNLHVILISNLRTFTIQQTEKLNTDIL